MTNEEAIKSLENDIKRYSKKEFNENTNSQGIQAVLRHRKEKLESYKFAINSIQENTKLKAEIEQLKSELVQLKTSEPKHKPQKFFRFKDGEHKNVDATMRAYKEK